MQDIFYSRVEENIVIHKALLNDEVLQNNVNELSKCMIDALKDNKKIVVCGNGGSASDALHFVGEIVGRFQKERKAGAAISLNSDVATMTAIANDYGYKEVFARQVEAVVSAGDVFIGISTSGNSENVINAVNAAKKSGATTAALLGNDGGELKSLVDYPVVVNSRVTARIQECHILIIHIICELVEESIL